MDSSGYLPPLTLTSDLSEPAEICISITIALGSFADSANSLHSTGMLPSTSHSRWEQLSQPFPQGGLEGFPVPQVEGCQYISNSKEKFKDTKDLCSVALLRGQVNWRYLLCETQRSRRNEQESDKKKKKICLPPQGWMMAPLFSKFSSGIQGKLLINE